VDDELRAVLSGTATAGNFCVTVYDSGNVSADWTVSFRAGRSSGTTAMDFSRKCHE
jgi:hypothetical protein